MRSFDEILARAAARHGGEAELEASLPKPRTARVLARLTDDRWLAEMTRSVFRAGFRWKVVDAKWAGFEAAFHGFDTMACAMLADEDLEALQADTRIIRNGPKIRTVRDNAVFVRQMRDEYGSFTRCVAEWPGTDIVGLWMLMKTGGARLGGMSGPMTLRSLGKDTFLLTGDVGRALVETGVVDRPPSGKRALATVQAAFNDWREATGRPLCQLSRILAMSV
jgi:3-methyladenine DNA glycosylase Tag